MKALFIDRDGTLVREPYDGVISNPDNIWLLPDVEEAIPLFAELNYTVFVVTVQPAVGQKRVALEQYKAVETRLHEILEKRGLTIAKTYACLHAPFEGCECKKPKPGLLQQAKADYPDLNFSESWVIGDKLEDVGLGKAVGAQTLLVNRDGKYAEGTADFLANDMKEAVDIIKNPYSS